MSATLAARPTPPRHPRVFTAEEIRGLPAGAVLRPLSAVALKRYGHLEKVDEVDATFPWRPNLRPDTRLSACEVAEWAPLDVVSQPDPDRDLTAAAAEFLYRVLREDADLASAADVKQCDPHWAVNLVALASPRAFRVRSVLDYRPIATVQDVAGDSDHDFTGILDGDAVARHIARHDPAAVLADCAAKHRVVDAWRAADAAGAADAGLAWAVRQLTGGYQDREGYRPDWSALS